MTNELLAPGNLVMYDGKPVKIVGIDATEDPIKYSILLQSGYWIERELSEISGIPITPELLEKGGFRHTSHGYWMNADNTVSIKMHNFYCMNIDAGEKTMTNCYFEYLHELQNALQLLRKPWDIKM